jgi:HK97 family phage portal protein
VGIIADSIRSLVPATKEAIAATVPTWEAGLPQLPNRQGPNYEQMARQGYMLDEIVFGCIEVRAMSAAEPKIGAFQSNEKVEEHAALTLLELPNPFMDGFTFWATIMMHLDIAGNAYVEKVRSRTGQVVELWLMRPDRVRIIPDSRRFIRGYSYTIGDHTFPPIAPTDIIHFKTRHPLDDYYGLSPMHVLAQRVDLDVWQRQFTAAFFKNAGVPAGLLNIKRQVNQQEKALIRQQWQSQYGGPDGWHKLMVIDQGEAEYTPMGLPLGNSGSAASDHNQINETRICAVYQVPPSLVPSMAGQHSASYANRVSDREFLWDSVLAPIYRHHAVVLTNGLKADFPDLDKFEFDLSDVRALQEDEDKKHARYRDDFGAGLIGRREARVELGYAPEPEEPDVYLVPIRTIETPSDAPIPMPGEAEAARGGGGAPAPGAGAAPPLPPADAGQPAAKGGKRGNVAALQKYWNNRFGEGKPGDFDACVSTLRGKPGIDNPDALCAWWHKEATGFWPGHAPAEGGDGKS